MAKLWDCSGTVIGSKYLGQVEADTAEEAKNKARKLDATFISLCGQCSGECEEAEVTEIYVEPAEVSNG